MVQRVTLFVLLALGGVAFADDPPPIAITRVNVVDVRGGALVRDATVVVRGDRVVAAAPGAPVPAGARVVDGSGRYLIPGLWDMHVHWYEPRFFSLFVANGVVGVRQMAGFPAHMRWRDAIARGELVGPRQVIASPIVDGANPVWPGSLAVTTAKEARAAVTRIRAAGFDFIKVYEKLTAAAHRAILVEARRQGIRVEGHVPQAVHAGVASDLGQRTIEHSTGILLAASREEAKLRPRLLANVLRLSSVGPGPPEQREEGRRARERVLATFDERRAAALFRRFAKNGTALVPTLTVERAFAWQADPGFASDPRTRYVPRDIAESWDPANDPFAKAKGAEDWALDRRVFALKQRLVGVAHGAGVRILAGTDVLNPFCLPGFSLHDELGLLVEAGLSPLDALRAATLHPAEHLGRAATAGAVEEGKDADLVMLEANPLEDIASTRRIVAVIAAGRLYERRDLDRLLGDAERLARLKPVSSEMLRVLEKDGLAAALAYYREARKKPDEFDLREELLNALGYQLLGAKKIKEAIAVFELNAEAYPQSANVHDSLGEALAVDGQREAAAKSYRRSLELDPKNENAVKMLEKLK